jgi:hypothetical protein
MSVMCVAGKVSPNKPRGKISSYIKTKQTKNIKQTNFAWDRSGEPMAHLPNWHVGRFFWHAAFAPVPFFGWPSYNTNYSYIYIHIYIYILCTILNTTKWCYEWIILYTNHKLWDVIGVLNRLPKIVFNYFLLFLSVIIFTIILTIYKTIIINNNDGEFQDPIFCSRIPWARENICSKNYRPFGHTLLKHSPPLA